MTPAARLPLLRARPEEIADRALVVGDPARARAAAAHLGGAREVAANREYSTWTGELRGRRLSVCSHGVGAAGAGVCFEELARAGVRVMVRAGTCGALRPEIADGELVIATGAVRDEGLTPRLVPLAYPAVADPAVVAALEAAATATGGRVHRGVVMTTDLFYPSRVLGHSWAPWQQAGVAAVEMELSALLIVAALHGIRAGGIFAVDGHPAAAAPDMSEYDPYRAEVEVGVERMIAAALEALAEP